MPKEYSPFTPGLPVPVELFVGRTDEINRLRHKVAAATAGRLQVAFLTGERGIGKSSLVSFVKSLVEKDYQVLGLHTFLGGVTELTEMVRRVFDRLLKESVDKAWHEKVMEFFGSHVRQVGLFGISVEFGGTEKDLKLAAHDFAPALRRLSDRLRDEKKGLLLILDDINGLASSSDFANWLKSLVDEIATSEKPLPLCLFLVGLAERRQSLISLQPSLMRVFDLIEIREWSSNETRAFFQNAFSSVEISLSDGALSAMADFSGGLPVLAHEIGDAAFKIDTDNHIDGADAVRGIAAAAEIVGRKHLEPQVFQALRSPRYRTILRKIARRPSAGFEFQRGEVRSNLNEEEKRVFDNFLRKMTELGVIERDVERGAGYYRFKNLLHSLYFSMEASLAEHKS